MWVKKITAKMNLKRIDPSGYEDVIETLAEMLEERDRIYSQYKKEGSHPLVEYTSNRGESNLVPNPLLKEWQTINKDALVYWRQLGLTPKGFKELNDQPIGQAKTTGLGQMINDLIQDG